MRRAPSWPAMGVAQRYQKVFVHHTTACPTSQSTRCTSRRRPSDPSPTARCPRPSSTRWRHREPLPRRSPSSPASSPQPSSSPSAPKRSRKTGPQGRALSRVRVRHAGPRGSRRAHQGRQSRLPLGGRLGLDINQILEAMKKLDYTPPRHFHLFPAPGPLVVAPDGKLALSHHRLRGAPAVHEQSGGRAGRRPLPGARHEGQPALPLRRHPGWLRRSRPGSFWKRR